MRGEGVCLVGSLTSLLLRTPIWLYGGNCAGTSPFSLPSTATAHNPSYFFMTYDNSIAGGPTARKILSPPIMACLAGLVIGLSPPLRWLLMREGAPLGPMWAAFSNLVSGHTRARSP